MIFMFVAHVVKRRREITLYKFLARIPSCAQIRGEAAHAMLVREEAETSKI